MFVPFFFSGDLIALGIFAMVEFCSGSNIMGCCMGVLCTTDYDDIVIIILDGWVL